MIDSKLMLDVDLRAFWYYGFWVFSGWFIVFGLLTKYFFVRRSTTLTLGAALAADAAMTLTAWVFVVAFPLSIFGWALIHELVLNRASRGETTPAGWLSVLAASAVVAVGADVLILRVLFRQKSKLLVIGILLLLNLACAAVAAYATATYALAHPPIA